jgi:hypothetical protein
VLDPERLRVNRSIGSPQIEGSDVGEQIQGRRTLDGRDDGVPPIWMPGKIWGKWLEIVGKTLSEARKSGAVGHGLAYWTENTKLNDAHHRRTMVISVSLTLAARNSHHARILATASFACAKMIIDDSQMHADKRVITSSSSSMRNHVVGLNLAR